MGEPHHSQEGEDEGGRLPVDHDPNQVEEQAEDGQEEAERWGKPHSEASRLRQRVHNRTCSLGRLVESASWCSSC
eukprot:5918566-Pyramimonas_sp.AAC.1